MSFYTFIMEYKGGTYVSQITAGSLDTACVDWAKQLDTSEIYGFGQKSKSGLIEEIKREEFSLISGLRNVWCASLLIRGELMLIDIVQTAEESDNRPPTTDN